MADLLRLEYGNRTLALEAARLDLVHVALGHV